jgi:hypothetical protein
MTRALEIVTPPLAISWLRYVPLAAVGEYLARGWVISDDMATCHHGEYSVLCVWKGEGEPK